MANHLAPAPRSPTYLSPPQLSPGPLQSGFFGNASLYVGDLEKSVTEEQLFDLFNQVGSVISVRVCRDLIRRVSLGYGYVNYHTPQEANRALEFLNFTLLNGKSIRVMFSQRNPTNRRSGYANIFIKNLDPAIDNKSLQDIFISFGPVLSCKVASDSNGQSKGYGFVQFENEESAQKAIGKLNGMLVNERKVYVGLFMRRQDRDRTNGSPKFTNVFVKNFPETFTEEDLKNEFSEFGDTDSVIIMRDAHGNSKCFGFVNFTQPGAAAAAVEKLNGKTIDDKVLYVGRAQKKVDREAELKAKFEQERNGRLEKLKSSNLYLKNLDESVNDRKLEDIFAPFGEIISCKVMLDSLMQSKGTAFVQFSSPEEANRAVIEMNGRMIGRKPLYVAIAQRKEERRARLQAHFAQLNAPVNLNPTMPALPSYHPGPARLVPPQLYYGQGGPGLLTPQPTGFGFQQQIIPGMRPGVAPNFMMPYQFQRHGQPTQRMSFRRGGMSQQMQQQFTHRNANQGFRYMQNYRNGVDPSAHQGLVMAQTMPLLSDSSSVRPGQPDATRKLIPISTLASALASAPPEQQRMMLGEQLYPLVEKIEQDQVGKVTGMLLEMDQTEVLHLIESPDALLKKVGEAMEVLRLAHDGNVVDQIG
ncbi:Polyadenylate-binding protein 5 [Platanthera zijinensis]|uniref:Polyadenylate-binding protein n=1 Tax=Platanthera zijinensis TaxID=2320716 RepID=A0AAP0FTG7_9ASPA